MPEKITAASYAASGSAIVLGLSAQDFAALAGGIAALVGALVGIATYITSVYFKRRRIDIETRRICDSCQHRRCSP